MANEPENEDDVLTDLHSLLRKTVEMGADGIELEYVSEGLEVVFMQGNSGLGGVVTDKALINRVVEELVREAKLKRKSTGKFHKTLCGKEYTILVKEYENFGESAFRLKIREKNTSPPALRSNPQGD